MKKYRIPRLFTDGGRRLPQEFNHPKIRAVLHPDDFNSYQSEADKADLGEALALANTAPVFSDSRLIVLTGVEKLRKEPKEALIRYLDNPLPTTTLVLTHNDSKK